MSTGLHCQAAHCRYPTTHNTSDHRCGRCWAFGHGESECDYWARKRDLATRAASQSPQAIHTCTIPRCRRPYTHTTSAHHCPRCRQRCDGSHVCPISTVYPVSSNPERSRAFDVLASASTTNNAAYTIVSVPNASGVYEDVYVRTHGLHREVESLTVHPASSASRSAASLREWFIMGRHYVSPPSESPSPVFSPPESPALISPFVGSPSPIFTGEWEQCPVCREPVSRSSGVVEVYGATLDGKCTVCLENPITHVFTACGHAVVCGGCAKHWK
jgi:hypothetical protein